jgi:hypothetical protein
MFSAYFVEHDVAPQHTNADYLPYVDGNCVTTAKLVGADLLVPDLAELMPT